MIEWIVVVLVAIIIGFYLGKKINERKTFGDKEEILNSKWKEKIANIEKEYEIKIEKTNSNVSNLKEQNKTELEKLGKEYEIKIGKINTDLEGIKENNKTELEKLEKRWKVKYIEDVEELKTMFKNSEKVIRAKSVSSSRRSLVGKFIERFIPFLKGVRYEASDMHFMGQPIDYIVFEGLHRDNIEKVTFLEVKTGESKLTKREKSLKDAIQKKKVAWEEVRVDTTDSNTPDKQMENEDTSISNLYEKIDKKISSVDSITNNNKNMEGVDYDFICPECEEEIFVNIDENDDLDEGILIDCPECEEEIVLNEEDLKENIEEEDEETDNWICEHCGEAFELDEELEKDIEEEGSIKVDCPYCNKKTNCEYEED